jgi:hypothetical protein
LKLKLCWDGLAWKIESIGDIFADRLFNLMVQWEQAIFINRHHVIMICILISLSREKDLRVSSFQADDMDSNNSNHLTRSVL